MAIGTWNHLEENWSEVYRVYERNEFSKNSQVETEKPLAGQAFNKPWASNLHKQERSYEMWSTCKEAYSPALTSDKGILPREPAAMLDFWF